MEGDIIQDLAAPKKGRQRKKQLYTSILKQMEFYFSDANLNKDRFLAQLMENDPYIEISQFLKFNKINRLTCNVSDIKKALKKSEILKLSDDEEKVCRTTPPNIKPNVDSCTVYVENIKSDTAHDWLSNLFADFGKVVYVSIPKYKHNKVNKGFAFVEFETEAEANEAIEYFDGIGSRMSSKISPEYLQSISTFEGESKEETGVKMEDENGDKKDVESGVKKVEESGIKKEEESEVKKVEESEVKKDEGSGENKVVEGEGGTAKRKKEEEGDEDGDSVKNPEKKLKIESDVDLDKSEQNEDSSTVEMADGEKKKKVKSKKSKKKAVIKELGLQILPKQEWKKLRNQYLDMQKKKMKQLKMHLNKRKFGNKFDYKLKSTPVATETQNNITDSNHDAQVEDKLKFQAGVIVKYKPNDVSIDAKKIKSEIKGQAGVKYIEIPHEVGNQEIFIRFSDSDHARKFISSDVKGTGSLLDGDEEQSYWSKIQEDRQFKLTKGHIKMRGREKLLKKAEKELGKHIRFDDNE